MPSHSKNSPHVFDEDNSSVSKEIGVENCEQVSQGTVYKVEKRDPVPHGTTFTLVLPWVDRRITEGFIFRKFRELDWGFIIRIDMLWKRERDGKPAHYKVFIHLGDKNPKHQMVYDHLETGDNELKVHYNDKFYWKVRKSMWKRQETGINVEFVTNK
jgi:hypothetical protein